jgi:flagellar hook assembly protein FlgD
MQTKTAMELISGQTNHQSVNLISSNLKNRYKLVYGNRADANRIIDEAFGSIPEQFSLGNNYPNPFNPETAIPFSIPEPSLVMINIYDITGREINQIVHEYLGSGFYTRKWNGQNSKGKPVSTGVYYYSIETKLFTKFKKMILLK